MTTKPYPEYTESGDEWLGRIPASWRTAPLWTLFTRVKRTGFETEELLSVYRDHGVVIKSSRDDNNNNASEDLAAYQLVEPGDLAINKMKAWQGSAAISEYRGIVSPAYFVFRPTHHEHRQFLHYLMRSTPYIALYARVSKGIRPNQWDLDPQQHSRLLVLLPPATEERQIADYLDAQTAKIDALIGKQERLIETLAERRQAVISHAVTKGLDPNAPTKDSGIAWLGQVPQSWLIGQVKHAGTVTLGKMIQPVPKSESDERAPYMRAANVQPDGQLVLDDVKDMWFTRSELDRLQIRRGDVVVVEGGMGGFGRSAYVGTDVSGWGFQNSINRLRPNSGSDGRYLTYLLLTARVAGFMRAICAAVSMPHLTAEKLEALEIPLPAFAEQTDISDHLDRETSQIDALSAKAREMIDVLQERRQALISAAVTGKIDVRGLA